jgi:hypothetical protein
MKTMSGPSTYSADSQADADLCSMPFDQFLNQYVDEIFSNYLDRTATLPEVLDEIKAIIAILIEARGSEGRQLRRAGANRTGKTFGALGQRR